jgi:Uma2 family endonuclease
MIVSANETVRARRFTREEYERMTAQGIFGPDERVELVEGEIVVMPAKGTRHTTVVGIIGDAAQAAFGAGYAVRVQDPLAIDPDGEPEPDVAVVVGRRDDYLDKHPTTAVLVVEVADTTLAHDRRKAATYARAQVQDYWIANLVQGVLELHRDPVQGPDGKWSYANVKSFAAGATVRPLAAPNVEWKVSDLLR